MKKLKVAIIGLTSCEGCQFSILDRGEDFLNLTKYVEFDEFRTIEEDPCCADHYDVVFVEGNPVTAENKKFLKDMRKRTETLVVMGNCAALGGVWEIRNYRQDKKVRQKVYKHNIDPGKVLEVSNVVKVDFTIPGCPINAVEFYKFCYSFLAGFKDKEFLLNRRPVCSECQMNEYECLLQKRDPCFGPISVGGCDAVCPGAGQYCQACRGILPDTDVKKFMKTLRKMGHTEKRIFNDLETFGARDHFEARLKEQKEEIRKKKEQKKRKT